MAAMELARLLRRVEHDAVFLHAGHAEVVADRADRDDQRVIAEAAARDDLDPVLVKGRRDADFLALPVQSVHAAETEREMVPVSLRQIFQAFGIRIEATRRDFVEQRLPQMRRRGIDQRDIRALLVSQLVAQTGRQFQSSCSTAHDDDFMHLLFHCHKLSSCFHNSEMIPGVLAFASILCPVCVAIELDRIRISTPQDAP